MSKKTAIAMLLGLLCVTGGSVHGQQAARSAAFTAADYFEIRELYARYTRAVDMGGCWGDNVACKAYVDTFAEPRAADNVVKYHQRLRDQGWASRHTYASLLITPTPEGADGSVYALIYNVTAKPPFVDHSVYYTDTLVKTPNGWRFKTRVIKFNETFKPSLAE